MAAIGLFAVFFYFAVFRRSRVPVVFPTPVLKWAWRCGWPLFVSIMLADLGVDGAALLVATIILFLTPSLILGWVIVPLGWPRLAYRTARCCWPFELAHESRSNATVYGALALARKPASKQAGDWLEKRLQTVPSPRGVAVVAEGLLAALRGDRDRARCLLLIADTLSQRHISRRARAVARDWLVVDAARIGNWREVIGLGRRDNGSLRWSYTIARIGERLVGDPRGCRNWLLWLCWIGAPRRIATLPLLRRAVAMPPDPKRTAVALPAARDLPEALAKLAQAIENRYAADGASFARTVSEVEARLDDSGTRALVERRLIALGARDADAVLARVRRQVVDLLAQVIEECPSLAGGKDRGCILDQAVDRVRARLFRDIEAQCKDYTDRKDSKNALSALAEWEVWAVTRNAADRLLELAPEQENTLFRIMYAPACNFAVFQQNSWGRTALAHAIYAWLHRHSDSDASATALLMRNVRASRG